MQTPVQDRYLALVRDGIIEHDSAQAAAVAALDRLARELGEYQLARKSSALGWFFGQRRSPPPRGLYIWGAVGRGKTMLMDLFHEVAPVQQRRRVHFHAFMANVHARIHDWRQQKKAGTARSEDPIGPVADALASQGWLLCFDEFSVTDITDAMILGRLFEALLARGVVVVATSNVDPARLYEGGLNRALFVPFIAMIETRMQILQLESRTDFRLEKLRGAPVYHVPPDATARAAISAAFTALTGKARGRKLALDIGGRELVVPDAANNVARFSFDDLCEQALGPSDYLAIAREFHTVLIEGIPVMGLEKRNEARRFVWLIDALYDRHVKVIASAEAEPPALYTASQGRELFEFERTASRLIEMRSQDYLALPHGATTSEASGRSTGLAET